MMPTIDKLNAWVRHYAVLQGVGDYAFSVSIVAGLKHHGVDAWAVVRPDPASRKALVRVRDIDATPIPGFDGDPHFEIRVTLSHEMFHVLLSEWIANPTVENEERVVEAAAQAVVRSEFGADAPIVARSIGAIPTAIRARIAAVTTSVSALASQRKGKARMAMDAKQVLAAIKEQDEAAALQILEAWLAEQIGGDSKDPAGDKLPGAPAREDDPAKPGGGAPVADARGGYAREEETPMARGRKALEEETKRVRKAADGTTAIFARARVRELRTDGFELDAALERELVAERDPDVLERRIADLTRGRTMSGQRARSGVQHEGAPPPAGGSAPPMTAAQLEAEGLDARFYADYQRAHRADPEDAAVMLAGARDGRARKVAAESAARARAARAGV